jgi:hypothetical protein
LVLVIGLEQLGSGAPAIGGVLALAYGAGTVGALAVPVLYRRVRRYTLVAAAPFIGAAGALALRGTPAALATGFAVLLLARPLWQIPLSERWLAVTDSEHRGRMSGGIGTVTASAVTLTPVITGLLVTGVGPAATATGMAMALIATGVLTAVNPAVRALDPDQSAAEPARPPEPEPSVAIEPLAATADRDRAVRRPRRAAG